jgi:hypothetical protein
MKPETEKLVIKFMKAHFFGAIMAIMYLIFFVIMALAEMYWLAGVLIVFLAGGVTFGTLKLIYSYKIMRQNGERKISEDMDMQEMLKNAG